MYYENKKSSILICCFIMIIVFSSFLFACDNNKNNNWYKVAYAENYAEENCPFVVNSSNDNHYVYSRDGDLVLKIDSRLELEQKLNEKGFEFFDEDSAFYNDATSKKNRSYEKDFFETNSLVIVVVTFYTSLTPARIDDIKINDNELEITVVRPDEDPELDALDFHMFIIEADKLMVQDVKKTSVKIEKRGTIASFK